MSDMVTGIALVVGVISSFFAVAMKQWAILRSSQPSDDYLPIQILIVAISIFLPLAIFIRTVPKLDAEKWHMVAQDLVDLLHAMQRAREHVRD